MLVSYEKDAEGLLNFAEANVEHFDPVNFGTLFNRLQKLRNPRLVRDDRFLLCLEYLEKVRARDGQEGKSGQGQMPGWRAQGSAEVTAVYMSPTTITLHPSIRPSPYIARHNN